MINLILEKKLSNVTNIRNIYLKLHLECIRVKNRSTMIFVCENSFASSCIYLIVKKLKGQLYKSILCIFSVDFLFCSIWLFAVYCEINQKYKFQFYGKWKKNDILFSLMPVNLLRTCYLIYLLQAVNYLIVKNSGSVVWVYSMHFQCWFCVSDYLTTCCLLWN